MSKGNSTQKWFELWQNLIYEKGELSRLDLAESSGASLWTVKALQKDFLEWDAYITYNNNKFKKIKFELEKSLSTLCAEEMR